MTVSAQTPINRSTGNGVTTVFPYTFKIISDADIEVTVDDVVKTLNVDYTVSGAGVDAGGNVTMTGAPANATSVVRRRNMALVRSTDYQDQGELPATTLDNDIDATVLMVQQLDERLDRTFSLPASFSGDSTLPAPEPGYLIGWDATGENLTNIPASVGSSLVDLAAPSGSSLIGYQPTGTGAVPTTVQAKLRESVSVKDFGAVGDGVTNDTAAVQLAINALGTYGGVIVFPKGNYLITARLNIAGVKYIKFVGESNGMTDPQNMPSCLWVKTLADYVFAYTGVDQTLEFESLAIDGFNGSATPSSVWEGLVTTSETAAYAAFLGLDSVSIGGSNSATPMLDLTHAFSTQFKSCNFGYWGQHVHVALGGTYINTTNRFSKCRFHYAKQNVQALANVTDIYFEGCIFESSIVAIAAALANVLMVGCYFENLGYDPSETAQTQGVTPRNILGISYAPAIASTVTSPIFSQYGRVTLVNPHFAYLAIAPSVMTSWLDGIGRGSGLGADGMFTVISPTFNASTPLFHGDAESPSARQNFIYDCTSQGQAPYMAYSDARLISNGAGTIALASGAFLRANINSGKLRIQRSSGIVGAPTGTSYPGDGAWVVGDQIDIAGSAGDAETIECYTGGTTASEWGVLTVAPKKKNILVAAAGNTTFTLPVPPVIGDATEVVITGTTGGVALVYKAVVTVAKLASADGATASNVVFSDGATVATAIAASSTSTTTTITVTNNNAGSVTYSFAVTART